MILPIIAYGAQVLRTRGQEITADYPGLAKLIEDMWETMYSSSGVGLAAPQINRDIRLFIIDSTTVFENLEAGSSIEEIIEQFHVTREQVQAVLEFAARSLDAPAPVPIGATTSTNAHPLRPRHP